MYSSILQVQEDLKEVKLNLNLFPIFVLVQCHGVGLLLQNLSFIELLFALYFLFGMVSAFTVSQKGDFGLFPFHLLLFIGFGSITYYGMKRT